MILVLAIVLSFIPALFYAWILYWLDRYEKEPRLLLGGVFVWGAIVATIGALIASMILEAGILFLTGSELLADISGTTLVAPIVEESLKGIAVLLVFLIFRKEFDSLLDGMVYAGITALGFAATENVLYLYFQGYEGSGDLTGLIVLFFLRVILGGWNHAVYTAFIGIGLAIARLSRNVLVVIIAPIIGWVLAVATHMLHNSMAVFLGEAFGLGGLVATLLVDWLSWIIMFAIVIWAISRERRWITTHLAEEVAQGTITQRQFEIARSSWAQVWARLKALFGGRYGATRQFYHLCAELAQKKHQLSTMGDEYGNRAIVEKLRTQLHTLSPNVPVK